MSRGGRRSGAGRKTRVYGGDIGDLQERQPDHSCHSMSLFRSRDSPNMVILGPVPCGSWGCLACSRKLKDRWKGNLSAYTQGKAVYACKVACAERTPLLRRVHRYGKSFVSVRVDSENYVIISTYPVGNLVNFDSIIDKVMAATYGRKPISTSRDWALPAEDSSDNWSYLGKARKDCVEVAKSKDYCPEPIGGERYSMSIPYRGNEVVFLAMISRLVE